MPWTKKQNKLWRAAEHDPEIAANVGISHEKATEFAHEGVERKPVKKSPMRDRKAGHHATFGGKALMHSPESVERPMNPGRPEHNLHPMSGELRTQGYNTFLRKDEHRSGGMKAHMPTEHGGVETSHTASAYPHGMEGKHVGGDAARERLHERNLEGHSARNLGRREHHDGSGGRNETNSPHTLASEGSEMGGHRQAMYPGEPRGGPGDPQGGQTPLAGGIAIQHGHPTDVGVWPHPDTHPTHVGGPALVDGTRGTQEYPDHQFAAHHGVQKHANVGALAHALMKARGGRGGHHSGY